MWMIATRGRNGHVRKAGIGRRTLTVWLGGQSGASAVGGPQRPAYADFVLRDRLLPRRRAAPDDPAAGASGAAHLDVLLVCSAGGHLMQLQLLRAAWEGRGLRTAWVTLDREDAQTLLADEDVIYAFGPTTRNVRNLVRNVRLAWRVLRTHRPRVILTTGAGVSVPFAWAGRLLGVPTVYVESLTRIRRPSLSCRLVLPAVDRAYAQWPELAEADGRFRYVGQVIDA